MKKLLLAVAAVAVVAIAAHRTLSSLDVAVSHVRGFAAHGGSHVASTVPHHLVEHAGSGLGVWTWSGFSVLDPLGPAGLRRTILEQGHAGWLEVPVAVDGSAAEWTSFGLSLVDDELWYGGPFLHGGWHDLLGGHAAYIGH